MIDFKVVQSTSAREFATEVNRLLNAGYGISWQTAVVSGQYHSNLYHVAHMSKEL